MKKKGDVAVNTLIGAVVILFVLVIVGFGLYSFFTGKAIPFIELLPGFNQTAEEVEDIARVRYDIREGNVEYYDGEEWLGFDRVRLGGHELSSGDVERDFSSYWINGERDGAMYDSASISYLFVMHPQGEVLIDRELRGAESRDLKPLILTHSDDLFYIADKGGDKPEINELEREGLIKAAVEWRESVLSKPVFISTLPYPPRPFYVCAMRIDDYLIADLDEEVSKEDKCVAGGLE